MKKRAIGMIVTLLMLLAACAPEAATTTTAPGTIAPKTTAPTTSAVTTKPAEKPKPGGTLNLVMLMDISSWDQGLTGC